MKALDGEPRCSQARLERGIHNSLRSAVAAIPENGPRAEVSRQSGQFGCGASAPENEGGAELFDRSGKSLETVMQPPAACRSEGTDAAAQLVEQEQHNDRRTALGGGTQCGIVGDAEIVPQPDDRRLFGRIEREVHISHSTRSPLKSGLSSTVAARRP